MDIIQLLFLPIQPFLAVPWLTTMPVMLAVGAWLGRARGTSASVPVAIAAVLWAFYSAWEISFTLVPVREWIRVDLLLIAPVLLAVSVWAVLAYCRRR